MFKTILAAAGLNQYSDSDLIAILGAVVAMSAIAGIVADYIMKPSGFGAIGNTIVVFFGFGLAAILFNNYYQDLRRAEEFIVVSFGMSFAFSILFAAAIVKNALSRTK